VSKEQERDDSRRVRAREVGLFRYGLISEALDPALSTKQRGRLVRSVAAGIHPRLLPALLRHTHRARRCPTSDFAPAMEQFLGSGAGLSAATITRWTDSGKTRRPRSTPHKMINVLAALPNSAHPARRPRSRRSTTPRTANTVIAASHSARFDGARAAQA